MPKPTKKSIQKTTKNTPAKSSKTRRTSIINTDEIKELVSFMAQLGLDEINIETEKLKVHLKRSSTISTPPYPLHTPPAPTPAPPSSTQQNTQPESPKKDHEEENSIAIFSPMIGTFYKAPNPNEKPFVSVGDKIEKGQVVCIIEAMKLFNEIESEVSGTLIKIIPEDASPVEYKQPLFLVRPE